MINSTRVEGGDDGEDKREEDPLWSPNPGGGGGSGGDGSSNSFLRARRLLERDIFLNRKVHDYNVSYISECTRQKCARQPKQKLAERAEKKTQA